MTGMLDGLRLDGFTISERLAALDIPGASLAVMDGYEIVDVSSFGRRGPSGQAVTADTMFQAGSISKLVTAVTVLALVDQGALDLDADVRDLLTRWTPPAVAAGQPPLSVRNLLGHLAGMTVGGFAGYPAGTTVPSVVEVLDGTGPTNSPPIVYERPGNGTFRYSGGGYTILQVAVEDACGMDLDTAARKLVFEPLGMTSTTFSVTVPATATERIATGHEPTGTALDGAANRYPELAAAGLWTTADDLARLLIALQQVLADHGPGPLRRDTLEAALEPSTEVPYGLGFVVLESPAGRWFGHNGGNAGYIAAAIASVHGGHGVVALTNLGFPAVLPDTLPGELLPSMSFAVEIKRAVAQAAGWPPIPVHQF